MSRERPTPYGTEESLALENARLRNELRRERRRARDLAARVEEAERRQDPRITTERWEYLERRNQELSRLVTAWEDPGPMPAVHRRAQRDVRHLMPVLVRRIEHVLRRP